MAVFANAGSLGVGWSGGETTIFQSGQNAYSLPLANIQTLTRREHVVGNSFFTRNWVVASGSPKARDGLGPLFNASSCSACHVRDGRGKTPTGIGTEQATSLLFRLSLPGSGTNGAPLSHPRLGSQLATRAIPGLEPEGQMSITYEHVIGHFGDHSRFELRKPTYRLELSDSYATETNNILIGPRLAPPVFGLGLLEAIPEASIKQHADPEDQNKDGISGRINLVWNQERQQTQLGRFGWKANQATLRQQIAAAFLNDIGITSSVFPNEAFTEGQLVELLEQPNGGTPEISDRIFQRVLRYQQTLAPPARRGWNQARVQQGERLFHSARCDLCHLPEIKTGKHPELEELSHQLIRPFTDLLLHDLGPALADGRPDFLASASEWRTPPLWGIGLTAAVNRNQFYLHDGRARTLSEAILWHGGEAAYSRDVYKNASKGDRESLIAFLKSL